MNTIEQKTANEPQRLQNILRKREFQPKDYVDEAAEFWRRIREEIRRRNPRQNYGAAKLY